MRFQQVDSPTLSPDGARLPWSGLFMAGSTMFFYQAICLKYWSATPGKLFLNLKVVHVKTGGSLDWAQCTARAWLGFMSFFLNFVPQAIALLNRDRRQLADWITLTRVIQLTPRISPARPRWIIGPALLIFFFTLSLFQMGYRFPSTTLTKEGMSIRDRQIAANKPLIATESALTK